MIKILNSYAKLSDLTTYLRSNDFDGLIAQLHKLTEELNLNECSSNVYINYRPVSS